MSDRDFAKMHSEYLEPPACPLDDALEALCDEIKTPEEANLLRELLPTFRKAVEADRKEALLEARRP